MALGNAHLGNAQYYPLARAVMGGLISATFLTLLVLPTYYVVAERLKNWRIRVGLRARRRPVPGEL
jgi:Cu/Ag efflux pump CusA